MSTVSTSKSKSDVHPPTVITITLNDDNSGVIHVRRKDLAVMSSFRFVTMREVVGALQLGIESLLNIEKNPPPKDVPSPITTVEPPTSAASTTNDAAETQSEVSESVTTEGPSAEPSAQATQSTASLASNQLSLL